MDNTHIWEIDMAQLGADTGIQLEIFSGRDKYTKAGLFSGPLRRQEIDPHSEDVAIRFLFSMTGATQTGKNTFRLSDIAASRLFQYFEQRQMSGVYCRLQDKKRHRVKTFIGGTGTQKGLTSLIYDSKSGALVYPLPESAVLSAPHALERPCSTVKPVPHLYLNMEENQIRGFLTFTYDGTEIQANSKLEEINLSSGILLRNFRYEREIQRQIYETGGNASVKNEITFHKKIFFSETLPLLLKTEIALFWGAHKERVYIPIDFMLPIGSKCLRSNKSMGSRNTKANWESQIKLRIFTRKYKWCWLRQFLVVIIPYLFARYSNTMYASAPHMCTFLPLPGSTFYLPSGGIIPCLLVRNI